LLGRDLRSMSPASPNSHRSRHFLAVRGLMPAASLGFVQSTICAPQTSFGIHMTVHPVVLLRVLKRRELQFFRNHRANNLLKHHS
jgi:hypothetical protein